MILCRSRLLKLSVVHNPFSQGGLLKSGSGPRVWVQVPQWCIATLWQASARFQSRFSFANMTRVALGSQQAHHPLLYLRLRICADCLTASAVGPASLLRTANHYLGQWHPPCLATSAAQARWTVQHDAPLSLPCCLYPVRLESDSRPSLHPGRCLGVRRTSGSVLR